MFRRHRGEIGEYAKEIGMTLNGLYMDDKVAKTDYYKRLCITLDRLESEGYDITKINVLRKKMVGLLNRNNSENREATKELRDRLKKDGYTQTPTAGIYEENGVNVLEHSFVIYTDKIDMEHRGKVYSKAHKYKCDFNELVEYGKQLCAKSAFDQECFSVKYPNYGDAVWMDSEGNVIAKRTMDLGFFTPSRPQRFSFVESLCKYQFPCGGAYRHIVSVDGIVEW